MTRPSPFRSRLGPTLARYVAVKRALGRRADGVEHILRYLDCFLVSRDAEDVTREIFAAWADSMTHLSRTTRRGAGFERSTTCVSFASAMTRRSSCPTRRSFRRPRLVRGPTRSRRPTSSSCSADTLPGHNASPLHREVTRIAVVILYTTGLRRGELVRLTLRDYDAVARVLHVRQTKFYKSRLVPLSIDAAAELDRFLLACQARGAPSRDDTPLLAHCHGTSFGGYTGTACGRLLHKVIRAAGTRGNDGIHFTYSGASHQSQ